jgi:hypothetical protein
VIFRKIDIFGEILTFLSPYKRNLFCL